jgi:hypothetical protein
MEVIQKTMPGGNLGNLKKRTYYPLSYNFNLKKTDQQL